MTAETVLEADREGVRKWAKRKGMRPWHAAGRKTIPHTHEKGDALHRNDPTARTLPVMPSLLPPPPPLSLPFLSPPALPALPPFLSMPAHGRPARCALSCPALPLLQAPLPVLRSASPTRPAVPTPVRLLCLALPFPPAGKTNGRRPHPAGCLPPALARLSLPLRLRPPASPVPQRCAFLPLPCLFRPDVAAAPRPALPSSQKDKRRAPAPRRVPCRPLLPHGGGKRVTRFPCRPAAVLSLPPAGMLALADIYGVNNILGSQRASCAP